MTGEERDRQLFNSFMDGLVQGFFYTLGAVIFVVIMFFLMFCSPEEKTKMICEPCAIVAAQF